MLEREKKESGPRQFRKRHFQSLAFRPKACPAALVDWRQCASAAAPSLRALALFCARRRPRAAFRWGGERGGDRRADRDAFGRTGSKLLNMHLSRFVA
mmetsp:Transcript_43578/g.71867  ORF Transcript_43578/g.71867 Transcript_43578/m.71867 type:complete len:98 (-) Transcript_43578:4-297(-)